MHSSASSVALRIWSAWLLEHSLTPQTTVIKGSVGRGRLGWLCCFSVVALLMLCCYSAAVVQENPATSSPVRSRPKSSRPVRTCPVTSSQFCPNPASPSCCSQSSVDEASRVLSDGRGKQRNWGDKREFSVCFCDEVTKASTLRRKARRGSCRGVVARCSLPHSHLKAALRNCDTARSTCIRRFDDARGRK